jgi:mannose-6-phosphate isomerase
VADCLHDWGRLDTNGRPRALHVERALDCIDWAQGPVRPVKCRMPRAECGTEESTGPERLVTCPYFHLDFVHNDRPWSLPGDGRLRALLVLHWGGKLIAAGAEQPLALAETVLVPASAGPVEIVPWASLAVLVATLPAAGR